MAESIIMRKDVPKELTWDLTLIYKTEEDMRADMEEACGICSAVENKYKGHLDTAENINACLDEVRRIYEKAELLSNYCELAVSVDYYDTHNQELSAQISRRLTDISSRLSFVESEISIQGDKVLGAAVEIAHENKVYIKDIIRRKPHNLNPEAERVLSACAETFNCPYEAYNSAKLADMVFPDFEADGRTYPLGYSLFEDDYEYDTRTDVRRAAFDAFSAKIRQYVNVTATAYNTQVRNEKTMADLRGYDSVFDYLLFDQKVDRSLYDRQIDLITERLAPHMRKYARIIKEVHKLDKMTYADLKLPIDPEYVPKVTIEESKEYIEKGLSVMGEDYVRMIRTAYSERWIDFARNQGKSTGGFCASPYRKGSFILLSWNDRMSDVFTLAHELGHAGHFKACGEAQSVFDTMVSSYFVEAPSTMNELLMANYLLGTADGRKDGDRFKCWVLSNMVGNTYYHNFVTHLLEAAYQRKVYRIIDEGGSVGPEVLNSIMRETLEEFWGDEVELTDGAELTWMRQPHYYMGLYSYTYSAGLTIATQMSKRIRNEGQTAVDDWKRVLAAGSTLTPVELAKLGGIDITTDKPLIDTIDTIGAMIDDICALTR